MKELSINQMERLTAGECDTIAWISGVSCGISLMWPFGTLIAGPTCIGTAIGAAVCYAEQ